MTDQGTDEFGETLKTDVLGRRSRGDYEDEATRSKLRMPAKSRTQSNPNKSTPTVP